MDKFLNKCEEENSLILPTAEDTSIKMKPKDLNTKIVKPSLKDIKAACRRGKNKRGRKFYSRLSSRNKPMPTQQKEPKKVTGNKHSLPEMILHGSVISVVRLTSRVEDFMRTARTGPGPRRCSEPNLSPKRPCEISFADLERNHQPEKQTQSHTRTFDIKSELRKIQLVREELDKIVIENRAH